MSKKNRLTNAMATAVSVHRKQKRKYTNEPYIVHPFAVAGLISAVESTNIDLIAAAFLHDTVEDTDVTLGEIEAHHGYDVAWYVKEVTDTSTLADGNRAARRKKDRERLSHISDNGKTLKLADIIDNIKSIHLADKDFADLYVEEKILMLEVLKGGDYTLFRIAENILNAEKLLRVI